MTTCAEKDFPLNHQKLKAHLRTALEEISKMNESSLNRLKNTFSDAITFLQKLCPCKVCGDFTTSCPAIQDFQTNFDLDFDILCILLILVKAP